MKTSGIDNSIFTALDVGTSKIAAIIARQQDDSKLEILAVGTAQSTGLKKGMVINIEQTVASIRAAIDEAEIMSELSIHEVNVGIAGSHINSINCEGMAPIKDKKEITDLDVERAIETAQAIQLPADQQVLHVLQKDFAIDDQPGINDPVGMSGYRLHAYVHMITCGRHPIQNLTKCVEQCGLEVSNVVLDQIASSNAVLTEDEKELGVCLLDIGGGTTDLAVFSKGTPTHTSVIPIGGDHVTNDIAVTFRTPSKNAEDVKIKYGCALTQFTGEDEVIEIPGVADRPAGRHRRRALAMIIEPRYEELFELVARELQQNVLSKRAVTGFVLTGGSAKIEGVAELASKVLNAPVRIGRPQTDLFSGLTEVIDNPIHATGAGLLLYARMESSDHHNQYEASGFRGRWSQIKSWLQKNF